MNLRKHEIGTKNLIGQKVTALRKAKGLHLCDLMAMLQVRGIDICYSSLSKLEGQVRPVYDKEVVTLCSIFGVSIDYLLGVENRE